MKERMVRMSNIISYRQAINEALTEEMERDSGVSYTASMSETTTAYLKLRLA